jgi:hypothetical protein
MREYPADGLAHHECGVAQLVPRGGRERDRRQAQRGQNGNGGPQQMPQYLSHRLSRISAAPAA